MSSNPIVKLGGRRWGLVRHKDQIEWLAGKFENVGAELRDCYIRKSWVQFSAKKPFATENVQIHRAVLFDGVLRVHNPTTLEIGIENGIGSAKGFGFGLLSLAPR